MSLLLQVLSETEELAPLVMPAWAFAAIAVAFFVILGFVTWSYRDVANRHSHKTGSQSHDSHGAGH